MKTESAHVIPTRVSLLRRLKDWDDQEGWKRFFDTYWKLIYSVACKAGLGDAEAQAVVQETIIGVAKKMPEVYFAKYKVGRLVQREIKVLEQRMI